MAGSWLVAHGSSLPILCMAFFGAVIAVLDLEQRTASKVLSLLLFNTLVGTFGGPVLMVLAGVPLSDLPPAALLLMPFLLGWAGHSVITEVRGALLVVFKKRLGEGGK